ncbi:MAG: hypothetical protein TUN42_08300 [Dehalogenimonas sp.]
MARSIEITLQPVYLKNDYIYIPAASRPFFPPGKPFSVQPVAIESQTGSFTAELQFNSKGYI